MIIYIDLLTYKITSYNWNICSYSIPQLQGNECATYSLESYTTNVHFSQQAVFRAVSRHSLLLGLTSRHSCLALMPSLLCGSPKYQSSFAERHDLAVLNA